MDRTIVSAGVLLASLLVAMPAQGQALLAQDLVWTSDRPDGHAPAGVMADFTLPAGQIYLGYRYSNVKFEGSLVGSVAVSALDVLEFFSVATLRHSQSRGEVDVRWGFTNFATLMFSVPFLQNKALKETDLFIFETSSDVLGDVSLRALFDILDLDTYRLSAVVGATLPTGKLGKKGPTAISTRDVLPYPMQGGSGTPDILIGATFLMQNDVASIGAQFSSVLRFLFNPRGYRLGNRYDFSVWGAYNLSDWASFSIRGLFESWGEIDGFDRRTEPLVDPLANPFAHGGERVSIPFGLNLYFREGRLSGHRLSLEYFYPVHEDLNGPQMSLERALVFSWQTLMF